MEAGEADELGRIIRSWAADLPGLDAQAFAVQVKLYQINLVTSDIYNGIAGEFSLNHIDVRVLMIIYQNGDKQPVHPSDLCRRLHLAPSGITYRLDRLNRQGLLERMRDESDGRALYLRLTDEGLRAVAEIVRRINAVTAERIAGLAAHGGSVAELDRQLEAYLRAWRVPGE